MGRACRMVWYMCIHRHVQRMHDCITILFRNWKLFCCIIWSHYCVWRDILLTSVKGRAHVHYTWTHPIVIRLQKCAWVLLVTKFSDIVQDRRIMKGCELEWPNPQNVEFVPPNMGMLSDAAEHLRISKFWPHVGISKIMIFIDIFCCALNGKCSVLYTKLIVPFTYLNISVIWPPLGPSMFG